MTNRDRIPRSYIKSVLALFFIYLFIVPAVLYFLEPYRLANEIADDTFLFVLKIIGIALFISLIVANWIKSDPEFDE